MPQQIEHSMDPGRVLIARALIRGLPLGETLTHLAVGDGSFPVDPDGTPSAIDTSLTGLVHEIGRAVYLRRVYVVEVDPPDVGPIVLGNASYRESPNDTDPESPTFGAQVPTNLVYFIFRFATNEAVGPWTEYALIGGGVRFIARGATLLDGSQGGDDRANAQVILAGGYTGTDSQTVTLTVTTGGGSGVAVLGWTADGSAPSGAHGVAFTVPITITGTGLTITFTGGVDAVLTQGDQWKIRATRAPQSPTFAAGGVYDPVTNRNGQVLVDGAVFRMDRVAPADEKPAAVIDVKLVVRILN